MCFWLQSIHPSPTGHPPLPRNPGPRVPPEASRSLLGVPDSPLKPHLATATEYLVSPFRQVPPSATNDFAAHHHPQRPRRSQSSQSSAGGLAALENETRKPPEPGLFLISSPLSGASSYPQGPPSVLARPHRRPRRALQLISRILDTCWDVSHIPSDSPSRHSAGYNPRYRCRVPSRAHTGPSVPGYNRNSRTWLNWCKKSLPRAAQPSRPLKSINMKYLSEGCALINISYRRAIRKQQQKGQQRSVESHQCRTRNIHSRNSHYQRLGATLVARTRTGYKMKNVLPLFCVRVRVEHRKGTGLGSRKAVSRYFWTLGGRRSNCFVSASMPCMSLAHLESTNTPNP